MINEVVEKMGQLVEKYKDNNHVTNQIFDKLKERKYTDLPDLTDCQVQLNNDIESIKDDLVRTIRAVCDHYHVSEIRLSKTFPYLKVSEKEAVLALEKELIINQRKLEQQLKRNEEFLRILIDVNETIFDSLAEQNQEYQETESLFLNRKF